MASFFVDIYPPIVRDNGGSSDTGSQEAGVLSCCVPEESVERLLPSFSTVAPSALFMRCSGYSFTGPFLVHEFHCQAPSVSATSLPGLVKCLASPMAYRDHHAILVRVAIIR